MPDKIERMNEKPVLVPMLSAPTDLAELKGLAARLAALDASVKLLFQRQNELIHQMVTLKNERGGI